jgi:hypothetical protein
MDVDADMILAGDRSRNSKATANCTPSRHENVKAHGGTMSNGRSSLDGCDTLYISVDLHVNQRCHGHCDGYVT